MADLNVTIIAVVAAIATYYYLYKALRGKGESLRVLPAIAAISEGVDSSLESGKPVFITPGDRAELTGIYAPMTLAGMNVLRYSARLCVRKGVRPIFFVPVNPQTEPLIDGIFREVCVQEGKGEAYRREDVMFFGDAFHMSTAPVMLREGVGMYVNVGCSSGYHGYMPQYQADECGAMVISGTARPHVAPVYIMSADYPLILEDVYAAGALTSENFEVMSAQVAGDVVKLFIVIATVLSLILAAFGYPALSWWK